MHFMFAFTALGIVMDMFQVNRPFCFNHLFHRATQSFLAAGCIVSVIECVTSRILGLFVASGRGIGDFNFEVGGIDHHERVGQGFDDAGQKNILGPDLLIGLFLFGNIADDALIALDMTIGIDQQVGGEQAIDHRSVSLLELNAEILDKTILFDLFA